MRCRRIISSATTTWCYINYSFLPLLLARYGSATLLQVAYLFRFYDFLAVLSQPPYYRWITALLHHVRNTFAEFLNLHITKKTCCFHCFAQIHRIWETWLRFIPFHLLSGVGIYASLLLPAKATNYTHSHIPLFLSSLPRDSDYWLIHGTIQTFFIDSIRLAIFFSLCIGYMSGLPLKTTSVLCRRSSLSLLPGATPFKSIMPRTV